eukprot:1650655-Prymnesium_polylepis.2
MPPHNPAHPLPPRAPVNNIGDEGATAVAAALKDNSTLQTLNLYSAPRRRSLGRCLTPPNSPHAQPPHGTPSHTHHLPAPPRPHAPL